MFNPFEGSAEIVRIKVNDLGTRIEENEEFYIYEIIQSVNEAEEIVGTIKVPKDTFIVDGELLYCLEDGVPEANYVKGDAYIRLKVVTEEFKKDENGNILPDTTEKYYKYINILVTDLLNIPLTVIKVEYKNDSDTANGVSDITLNEEISEDGRIRTYTLVIERTTFVKDVSVNDKNDIIDTPYAIAEIIENTENPEHQSFEVKKVELPTKLPNEEPLKYKLLNKQNSTIDNIEYKGDTLKAIGVKEGKNITFETVEDTNDTLVYTINATSVDTHYEGKNIISTTNNTSEEVGTITNGNLKLNYIEGYPSQEECKSSIPIIGEDGIQVVKNVNDNAIIVNAKEIQTQLENGIKNPKPHIFTDGKTSVVYNGSEQKQTVVKEGDNVHIGSEGITNGGAYTVNAEDTNYKIIVTTEDNPLNDVNGKINNEELQIRLIEISQVWDETTQKFTEKEAVKKIIPLSGANRTQVYKNSGDSTIYIDTPEYNFGDGFEHSDNDVDLNFDVDGWTINAGKISHYCTCSTAKDISIKDVYSNKPFTYENGSMIAVRFSEGNTGYVNINFNGKTVPVYQGNNPYKTDFRMNTVLWLMYYDNGLNNFWLLIGAPSVQETKNIITSSSLGTLEGGTITNGKVYLNHLNDYQVKSSHLIKGENGIEVTADGNEISISAPDIDVTSLDEGSITSLNYGATFTVDSVSSGNNSHEIIVEKKHFKLPDAPTSTGGGEHYIAKHVLSDSPTGTTPVGTLTGTSDNPIYLNLIDGTENTKYISSLAIYGSGSTKVSTDSQGDELIIDSSQQDYGIADEDNPGLIKDGGDISVDDEGNVTVNTSDALRGYVYLDGLMLSGKDFAEKKNISSFAWCFSEGNEIAKEITLDQSCSCRNGLTLNIGFANNNIAENPTLYIKNIGSNIPIYYNGTNVAKNLIKANKIYTMIYSNGFFHITNINDNTITQILPSDHEDNAAVVGFSKMDIGDTIAYQPIYKTFATTDTNSKTIIDITKEPATGTPFVTDIDLSLDTANDTRTYTPNYSTLEAALPNAMGILGEEIIDVTQEDGNNGIPSWKVSHKITNRRYGENKTSSVTGANQTSEFGGTVKIPDIYYDKFGHIITANTAYIELPSIEQIPVRYGLEIKKDDNDGKYYIQHINNITEATVGVNNGSSNLKYGDSFNVPQITYDNQGHIKETYVKNFTLPKAPPEQKFYRGTNGISVDNSNYTVGHTNSITASTTVKNETISLSYDSRFKIPVITYDSEGHITKKEEQTLTLPSIPNYSEIPGIPSELIFQGDNIIDINKRGNTVKFDHKKSAKQQETSSTKSLKFGEGFEIETLTSDDYGHITKGTKTTIKLPSIPDYSEIPNTPKIPKQLTIVGKSGITASLNNDKTEYTIAHTNNIKSGATKNEGIRTLKNGDNFSIPYIKYDSQGHIVDTANSSLTLKVYPNPVIGDHPSQPNTAYEYVTYNDISNYRVANFNAYDFSRTEFAIKGQVSIPLAQLLKKDLSGDDVNLSAKELMTTILGLNETTELTISDVLMYNSYFFLGCLGINNMFDSDNNGTYFTHYIIAFVYKETLYVCPFVSPMDLSPGQDGETLLRRRIKQSITYFS